MQLEKIITREDGEQIKINVALSAEYFRQEVYWKVDVFYRQKGKRNWINVVDINDWRFRSNNQRSQYIKDANLTKCTDAEILEVKTALWESIKPV